MESLTNSPSSDTLLLPACISGRSEHTYPNVLLAPNSLGIGTQTEREARRAKPRKITDHKPRRGQRKFRFQSLTHGEGPQGGKRPARLCGGSGNCGYSGLEQGAPRPIAKGTAGTASPAPTLRRREHRHHLVGESACRQLAGSSAERPPQVGGEMEHVLPAPPGGPPAAHLGPCGSSRPQNAAGKRENAHGAGSARCCPPPGAAAPRERGTGCQRFSKVGEIPTLPLCS